MSYLFSSRMLCSGAWGGCFSLRWRGATRVQDADSRGVEVAGVFGLAPCGAQVASSSANGGGTAAARSGEATSGTGREAATAGAPSMTGLVDDANSGWVRRRTIVSICSSASRIWWSVDIRCSSSAIFSARREQLPQREGEVSGAISGSVCFVVNKALKGPPTAITATTS